MLPECRQRLAEGRFEQRSWREKALIYNGMLAILRDARSVNLQILHRSIITQAEMHRVLKWTPFVFRIIIFISIYFFWEDRLTVLC